ncbi:hypothetical protein GGS20DRAFT_544613 [Poronia punctata]|nr:hypothetical protein GGS20DRAFT_544613 [Poronia punctata]
MVSFDLDTELSTKSSLPPVKSPRPRRSRRVKAKEIPYSLPELVQHSLGLHPDLIWGPFYQKFRAARIERDNWKEFNLDTLWSGIPATTQKRPGILSRCIGWLEGEDPRPTLSEGALKTGRGRMNRHLDGDEDDDDDDDNEDDSDDDEDTPGARPMYRKSKPPTSGGSAKGKPVPWTSKVPLNNDWSPTQIDFSAWHGRYKHPQDYDDTFYHNTYLAVYNAICQCVDKWFGSNIYLDDWRDSDADISIWQVPMTDQFVQYARCVAHEDVGYVNWHDILNDPAHRKWLVAGIFGQIIERNIFNSLLFGASESYKKELERHDSQWVLQEGFTRKEGRRQIARAALNNTLLPSKFWDSVDDLAGQTILIFQPLFTLMCLVTGKPPASSGAMFLQEVHSILAMAGYFQICTAISPSIFHILSATPGARFQYEEETHADHSIYHRSRDFHGSHNERWHVLADAALSTDTALSQSLLSRVTDPNETASYTPLPTTEEEYRYRDHFRRRGGKVMYAVFPKLTRYSAENIGSHLSDPRRPTSLQENEGGQGEGMRISLLSKCLVVYYQGLLHSVNDLDDGTPLDAHLRDIALSRMPGHFLPYMNRTWRSDGKQNAARLHWPLWPEHVDRFWLWWLMALVTSQTLRFCLVGGDFDFPVLVALLAGKSFAWYVLEAGIYVFARGNFLRGHGRYWKLQVVNLGILAVGYGLVYLGRGQGQGREGNQTGALFAKLAGPLAWLDGVVLGKLPEVVVKIGEVLGVEKEAGGYVRSVVQRYGDGLGSGSGNGSGSVV